jgi:hypothetical protein
MAGSFPRFIHFNMASGVTERSLEALPVEIKLIFPFTVMNFIHFIDFIDICQFMNFKNPAFSNFLMGLCT